MIPKAKFINTAFRYQHGLGILRFSQNISDGIGAYSTIHFIFGEDLSCLRMVLAIPGVPVIND